MFLGMCLACSQTPDEATLLGALETPASFPFPPSWGAWIGLRGTVAVFPKATSPGLRTSPTDGIRPLTFLVVTLTFRPGPRDVCVGVSTVSAGPGPPSRTPGTCLDSRY